MEYDCSREELCEIALICVQKEGRASADLIKGTVTVTSQISMLCSRPLLQGLHRGREFPFSLSGHYFYTNLVMHVSNTTSII